MPNETLRDIKYYSNKTFCWIEYDNHEYCVVGEIQPEVKGSYWKAPEDCIDSLKKAYQDYYIG